MRAARGYSLFQLLIVLGITSVIAVMAVPMSSNAIAFYRVSGDARDLSNAITVTKMRAASQFSQARLYIDRTTGRYHMETLRKSPSIVWQWEGGATDLSQGVSLGYGSVPTPPPNTQAGIAQAPACLNTAGNAIGNTACIVFNSRGIPIDSVGAPTTSDAVYVTDGRAVYAVTVIATGLVQVWRTQPATASWTKQ